MSVDLTTDYLGFELAHPVVASAGPVTGSRSGLEGLAEAGVAAVVLPSLFEEEVSRIGHQVEGMLAYGAEVFGEATSYFPDFDQPLAGDDEHIKLVTDAKSIVDVPVIASLNGVTPGGWTRYAGDLVEAGADAIELNLYLVAANVGESATDVEKRFLDVIREVRDRIDVPLAVKLSPFFTATAYFAREAVDAGADGLVLFNRFYQPDIDLDALEVASRLHLSTSEEIRLPLRWIAILRGRVDASLGLSSGVHHADDVVKAVLAGADVAMSTSAILHEGASVVSRLRDGLEQWLEEREYESVRQAVGSLSQQGVPDPEAYERANYVAALRHWATTLRV